MASSSDSKVTLVRLLTSSRVPEQVIKYMTDEPPSGMGLAAVSDFASMFKDADYEDKCQTHICAKVESVKEDLLAVARVRTAWTLARSDLQKACKAVVEGSQDADWDRPLDEDEEEKRHTDFDGAYGGLGSRPRPRLQEPLSAACSGSSRVPNDSCH